MRRRTLQVGFVLAALLAVWVADRTAGEIPGSDLVAWRLQTLLVVAGRVVAGWAAGMAFRLQVAPRAAPDQSLRLLLGVPLGALAAWPIVRTGLPRQLADRLPGWFAGADGLAPVAGLLLGVTIAMAVTRAGR